MPLLATVLAAFLSLVPAASAYEETCDDYAAAMSCHYYIQAQLSTALKEGLYTEKGRQAVFNARQALVRTQNQSNHPQDQSTNGDISYAEVVAEFQTHIQNLEVAIAQGKPPAQNEAHPAPSRKKTQRAGPATTPNEKNQLGSEVVPAGTTQTGSGDTPKTDKAASKAAEENLRQGRELASSVADALGDGQDLVIGFLRDNQKIESKLDERRAPPSDYSKMADAYANLGQPKDAERGYTKAIERGSKEPDDFSKRAQIRFASGDKDGAVKDAKRALELDPHNQLATVILGHDLSQAQNRAKLGQVSFGAGSKDADLSRTGTAALGSGKAPPAAAPKAPGPGASLPTTVSPAAQLLERARSSARLGDFSAALLHASQAVDMDPKNPKAWALRAEINNSLKNFAGAIHDAEEALKLEPDNAQALRAKAYAELEQGDLQRALQDAERAISLEPGNGLGHLYRGLILEKLGRSEEAIKELEEAARLDPGLKALADEALARLGAKNPISRPAPAAGRLAWRGGTTALAAGLILLGLLGAAAGKRLTTRRREAAAQATLLDTEPRIAEGSVIGQAYRVTGELGRGGMGVVYRAMDEHLQRPVAIKRLQRVPGTTSEDLERLLKEARFVASLKHPNIAEIYTVLNEGDLFLVFELVDGEPLDKLLARGGAVPVRQARRMLAEIGAALECAHARKIVHRDLKPSNIMVAMDGSVKVMDFGIAHQSREGKGMTMTSASGTPPYMAPEQALGSVSNAADYYALGVVAYELLTGGRPFPGPDYLEQKLQKRFSPASQRNSNLRRGLDAFFARALDPDPTKRPSDSASFLREFDAAAGA